MSRDYQGPYYSLDDLRSVIDAMCKSLESSGLIDEHEHPSACSTLLDTSKWMAEMEGQEPALYVQSDHVRHAKCSPFLGRICQQPFDGISQIAYYARPVPAEPVNARLLEAIKRLSFCAQTTGGTAGRDEGLCAAIGEAEKAIAAAESQQERLLQDMHDAGREIDRVMAEADPKEPIAEQPVNTRLLTALKACRHQFAHYVAHHISKGDMHKAGTNDAMVAMADVAIMGAEAAPRVARLTMGECMQAVKHISFEEMTLFGIARAIEVAVLRKNGIEVAE